MKNSKYTSHLILSQLACIISNVSTEKRIVNIMKIKFIFRYSSNTNDFVVAL